MSKPIKEMCQLCHFHLNKPSRCERKGEYVARKKSCEMYVADMKKYQNYVKVRSKT